MTNIQKLINHNIRLTDGCPHQIHWQQGIPERVAFLDKWIPIYEILKDDYGVGECTILPVIMQVAKSNPRNLSECESKLNEIINNYRNRKADLTDEAYKTHVNNITRYNDQYKYYRNRKPKQIPSFNDFIAKLRNF